MSREVMGISGFCIVLLLLHVMLDRNPVGLMLYLVLPLPLNIILFAKNFADWIMKKEATK